MNMMNMPVLKFQYDEKKAVEALTHIASKWPGVTVFFASKILFFAEKYHLNRYGRPIVADTFIAMPNGPVPSSVYDMIKGRVDLLGDPESVFTAIEVGQKSYPQVRARRAPDLDVLSPSDVECLDEAIAFCRQYSFSALSSLTHQERAWMEAPVNGPMDYQAMIDEENPARADILQDAREFAAYGVL
ncbi:Panacea domain-containing protein [Niveispirillum fermenti]|uniref:Panacea domain-containing protein n=1 Tax=Niveispirillum fermenti TaxID=1233113 RepID=UPI003A875AD4